MTRLITEKGDGVVLVLSAAVLVIVIDARAEGWVGMARVGDLTETRRHRGFACIGGLRNRRSATNGYRGGSEVGRFVGSHEPDRLSRARNVLGSRRQSKIATTSTVSAETK